MAHLTFDPLTTPKLLIRPVTEADLDDLLLINGDPEVTRFLPYATWTNREDAVAWFSRMKNLVDSGAGLQLVLVERTSQQVIGTLLLFKFDLGSARLEVGYVLGRAFWGTGLMREALAAVCTYVFRELGIRRLEAEVNPANVASNRLLRKLGFVQEGLLRQRWVAKGVAYDTNIYGLLAEEWPPI